MDFLVEATVPLSSFPDQSTVQELISSHHFSTVGRTRGGLRIRGSFLKLKSLKDCLEQLLESENQTWSNLRSTSSEEKSSYPGPTSGRTTGRTGSRTSKGSSPISPSDPLVSNPHKPPTSSDPTSSCSPGAGPKDSFRPENEFLVDTDVYKYATLVRGETWEQIQQKHRVRMVVQDMGSSSRIALQGRNAMKAKGEVVNLMEDLGKSLCTQDVLLKDLTPQGRELLSQIQKRRNIYHSVLVYKKGDGLRLVGSSRQSYELKQKLLSGTVEKNKTDGGAAKNAPKQQTKSKPTLSDRFTLFKRK